jgi:hypothetical protein
MQLQAMTNRWVEEDWAARPSAFLKPYISKMLDDSASAQGIMKVCELEYDDGREYVRRALAGSMQDMPRSLMLAWHRFLGAFRIADAVKKAKPNFTALPIDAIVVEEAAAWTITSVDLGVRFFLGHPDQEASDRIRNQNLFQTEVERVTRASSSETEPTFTRRFSEILTAQAMTQSNTRDLVERGVRDLLTLRAETDASTGDLEVAWVDHSLLKAYIQLDDRAAAESFATKIAAKIVVRTSIAR